MSLEIMVGFTEAIQNIPGIDSVTEWNFETAGEIVQDYLIDNFYNGADNAVDYMECDFDREVFIFKIHEG